MKYSKTDQPTEEVHRVHVDFWEQFEATGIRVMGREDREG